MCLDERVGVEGEGVEGKKMMLGRFGRCNAVVYHCHVNHVLGMHLDSRYIDSHL